MARFGDTVNPALGAVDYTPFLQGSMQGSAFLGQGIANVGAGAGAFLGDLGQAKKDKAAGIGSVTSLQKFFEPESQEFQALGEIRNQLETAPLGKAAALAKKIPEIMKFGADAMQNKFMRRVKQLELGRDYLELGQTERLLNAQLKGFGGGATLTYKKGPFGVTYAVPSQPALDQSAPTPSEHGEQSPGTGSSSWGDVEDGDAMTIPQQSRGVGKISGAPSATYPMAGQTMYPSKAAESLDADLLKAHGVRHEMVPKQERSERLLIQLAEAAEDMPDAEGRMAIKELANAVINNVIKPLGQGGIDFSALGEDPATKMMIQIARENALEKAAERNERMTDQDVVQELKITMHPAMGKEEALRIVKEKLKDIRLNRQLYYAEREFMQSNNGSLLGFDPSGHGVQLRDLTPEEIRQLPMGEWDFRDPEGGSMGMTRRDELINKQRAKERLPARIPAQQQQFMQPDPRNRVKAIDDFTRRIFEDAKKRKGNQFAPPPQLKAIDEFLRKSSQQTTPNTSSSSTSATPSTAGAAFAGPRARVVNATRDQIKGFKSKPGARYISTDFNDASNKSARGIEAVVPSNATKEEERLIREWAKQTQQFFGRHGMKVPVRRGDGIKRGGRGVPGVIHLEPFFAANAQARKIIAENPDEYARVMMRTIGQIPGATIIPPHKSNDPGAVAPDGVSEREFSRKYIIPALAKI